MKDNTKWKESERKKKIKAAKERKPLSERSVRRKTRKKTRKKTHKDGRTVLSFPGKDM